MKRPARLAALPALILPMIFSVAACGEPPPPPTSSAGSPGVPSPPAPQVTVITVTVTGGKVTPPARRIQVDRGQTVRVTVTSDIADEFHLHGYDRTLDVRPGRPATLEFTADLPGVFEAEMHHSGARVFDLQVG
ncbi:hypothetical protein DPM19_17350 [Actinomadura craniellae]|uniref:EfeO-type cupredoxin-like domain-containing protein n=1 Tax=Actinomadura craniellae TaxID=2231787 RepID=A0A365H4L8_9ACTN|nr:hypothetical protein [Actinomadura craniellae]RAY14047.1 hypothetical protein DPM19_17350 [Actinomadura craniellae]